jgi:hypothetical protein
VIYITDKLCQDERRFLDSEIESAVGTFRALVMKENATYVAIEWVKNVDVLLPDRDMEGDNGC